MMKILKCRRSSLALLGMIALSGISLVKGIDTSAAIAAICIGVAGANAYEGKNAVKN
jgi:hypothetical protein